LLTQAFATRKGQAEKARLAQANLQRSSFSPSIPARRNPVLLEEFTGPTKAAVIPILLTNKSHHTTGKNNIKPQSSTVAGARWINRRLTRRVRDWDRLNQITRINTDMKKWARVHSLREWGRVKEKLFKQACKIFAFFCQSQLDGII
jgi:hypothetical protein